MTANDNHACLSRLFDIVLTIGMIGSNYESSKHTQNKTHIIVTHGVVYCQKLPFSGNIHAPICNIYTRKTAQHILKLVCHF